MEDSIIGFVFIGGILPLSILLFIIFNEVLASARGGGSESQFFRNLNFGSIYLKSFMVGLLILAVTVNADPIADSGGFTIRVINASFFIVGSLIALTSIYRARRGQSLNDARA